MIEGLTAAERTQVSERLLEQERRFLDAYPDAFRRLDETRVRQQLDVRLSRATPLPEPLPHVVVHDLLDHDLYRMVEAAWPVTDVFRADARRRKFDLVPATAAAAPDPRNAGYDLLPPALRRVWDFVVFVINRQIVGPWLARAFRDQISARLALLQRAQADGLVGYSMAGARDWSYRANVGRFMIRGNGYALKPHLDGAPYLATALMYFPEPGQPEGFGTILYTPNQPLDFETVVKSGSTEYFEEAGIECAETVRVPYRPNTLLAFPNTLTAAHGVVAPEHGYRRVFQYHLSLKGDDEKV